MRESRRARRSGQITTTLLLVAATTVVACERTGGGAPDGAATTAGGDTALDTTATPVDTIRVEGEPQAIRVADYRSPAGFPLAFATRLPERIDPAREESDAPDGAALRFTMNGTDPNAEVYLRVVPLSPDLGRNDALARMRAIATDFGPIGSRGLEYTEGPAPRRYDWADTAYRLRGQVGSQQVTGYLALGHHAGRFFYVMELFPTEYSEGVGPRFDYVLRHWRWTDTNAPLARDGGADDVADRTSAWRKRVPSHHAAPGTFRT